MTLDSAFRPSSIAVYGASATRSDSLGSSLLRNAVSSGLPIVAVHPSAGASIEGVRTSGTLADAGGAELALVSVPARSARAAVQDAVEGGAKAIVLLSSGFAEEGLDGRVLQDEIVALTARADVSLIGPNCMGVVSRLDSGQFMNGSYYWSVPDAPGGMSFVSQSGAIGGMFLAESRRRRAGFARFISIGNAASVDLSSCLEWLASDAMTTAVGVFVEGIVDGERFLAAAQRACAEKPVVVLKGGRSDIGARAAASHTGSLAGAHGPARAAFLRAGVEEARSSRDLFDRLFSLELPPSRGLSIAIVTVSGGPSVLAADAVSAHGLRLAELEPSTVARLRDLLPSFAATANPVDLTPQCAADNFVPAIRAVFDDPGVDAVVAINCGLDVAAFGDGVVEAAAATAKPVVANLLDVDSVERRIALAGIPVLDSPEASVEVLGLALRRQR